MHRENPGTASRSEPSPVIPWLYQRTTPGSIMLLAGRPARIAREEQDTVRGLLPLPGRERRRRHRRVAEDRHEIQDPVVRRREKSVRRLARERQALVERARARGERGVGGAGLIAGMRWLSIARTSPLETIAMGGWRHSKVLSPGCPRSTGSLHSGRIPPTCALQPSEGSPIGLGGPQPDPLSRSPIPRARASAQSITDATTSSASSGSSRSTAGSPSRNATAYGFRRMSRSIANGRSETASSGRNRVPRGRVSDRIRLRSVRALL